MWIEHDGRQPRIGQPVFYFFAVVGVCRGHYRGQHSYVGENGWLFRDVTHWSDAANAMADDGKARLPARPPQG